VAPPHTYERGLQPPRVTVLREGVHHGLQHGPRQRQVGRHVLREQCQILPLPI
jgi:hypothetical protein